MEFRVRAVLENRKDWVEAKDMILKSFKINDTYGNKTPYDKLRDLEKGLMLSSLMDVYNYSLDHTARVSKLDNSYELTEREKVRGLYGRISGEVLRQIGLNTGKERRNLEDMKGLPYKEP